MNYECITTRIEGDKVAIITLNRPKALNALNDQLMNELDGTPNKARLGANAILGAQKDRLGEAGRKAGLARARIAAQATDSQRQAAADVYYPTELERAIQKGPDGYAAGGFVVRR